MSQQVDSSISVPAPIPSVRALQASPEVLTPVRHGFLWKRSRLFKTWISRWFQLDTSGFLYAVSPKVIKREGQSVLPSPVREVLQLPPKRYRNGATMYGIRVISVGGSCKDLYTDDHAALDAWALDLSRCTQTAREQAAASKASAAAAAASQPPLLLLPPPPPSARAALGGAGELHLSDICEVDWSHMLGSGLFACVLRARMHVTGEAVAVKIIKAESFREYSDIIDREAAVWAAAGQHPHIVQLKQTLRSSDRMYFIAELCEGGGLVERLATSATYCEREVAWLVRQLLAAVEHLHSNAIVHMDIKPENLVFATRREDSYIKLIDFSLASFFYSPTDPGGTPDFVAPELLNRPEYYSKNGCGPEVDMWAVGVIIFFLLSGQTPFQAPTLEAVLLRVKTGEWAFHGRRWALVSEGARDLISSLLKMDPSQRLTASEALDHPWLRRPDSLSQALLQDAVTAFRLAAAASMQQQRTSWVKQASGDLMTTTGTNGTNLSPHTSLSRFAVMAGSVGPASFGGGAAAAVATGMSSAVMGAALTTGGGHCLMGLMSSGAADAVAAMIGPSGAGASSAVMMSSSASQHQLNQAAASVGGGFGFGGCSARGSLAGGQRGSNTLSAVAAGTGTAGVGSGGSPPTGGGSSPSNGHLPQQNSFTAGVGARYAAAVAMAPHCSGSGSAGSPPRLPAATARISPHNSHHSPGGCTQRSPRSPLGMRTRRASDTMAYTLASTERQESIHQMQVQGIVVPPAAGRIGWPGLPSAKARRASELLPVYSTAAASCVAPSPSDSQAELAAASAAVAAASASVDRGNHSAPGTRYGHHHQHHHNGHHHPHYGHPLPLRGASGLSVMTTATATCVATSQGEGRPTGGRSNPELFSMLPLQSSNGGRSVVSSSTETTPHTSSRDGMVAVRNSWTNLPSQTSALGPTQVQGQPHSQQGQPAGASLPACDQALLAMSKGLRQGVPGKSQSYNVMPTIWVDRPAGRGQSTGQSYNAVSAAAGGPGAMITRRASMSFTLGASVSGIALMPHGPSPLSNSSGGRNFLADAQTGGGGAAATTAVGASGGSMPALLLLKRPSRGISGGGNLGARSSSSTPAHASPANSSTNLQAPSYSTVAGASGGSGIAARSSVSGAPNAGGTSFPSASSMYAAVLRSNLSGHGLGGGASGNAATSSGGTDGAAAGAGGLSDEGVARQSSHSASGSVTVGNNIQPVSGAATGVSPPPTRLGSSVGPTSSPPSPLSAAITNIAFAGGGGGGCGGSGGGSPSNSDPFILVGVNSGGVSGGAASWDNRPPSDRIAPSPSAQPPPPPPQPTLTAGQLMHEEFRGVMYSSGSNVISGSNLIVSDRLMTQGSFIEATLMTANINGLGTGHFLRSGTGGTAEFQSGPHGRVLASTGDSNGNLKGGVNDPRRLQQPPPSTMALLRGVASSTVDSENDVFSIAMNIAADGSDGAGSSGNGAGGGGQLQSGSQLRSRPRSGSQPSLVRASGGTSPNSDVSPRADCNQAVAGGVITGNSPRGGATAGASSLAMSASGSAGGGGPGSGTAPTAATDSLVETLRSAGVAPRASSRLVLETIPSEDPDSLSGLLRSVREERAAAIASAASVTGGGSAAIASSASGSSVGAGGFSSGPGGFCTGASAMHHTAARPLAGQQQLQQQQSFSPAPSPLSRHQVRAFLSPQASSSSLAAASLLPSSKSVLDPSPSVAGGTVGGQGSGGGTKEQQHEVRTSSGGSSGTVCVSQGSGSIRSTGSVRSGYVRRSATSNNLRLHATTAAAAQAAAAAAATAGDCIASEPDPFAAWDYPPPCSGHTRQRATSAVGLSGASLMALLAQAAPLAQAAQASAAAQIANSQSTSGGSSFTSQRSGLVGGHSGSIRPAVGATPAVLAAGSAAADGAVAGLVDAARTESAKGQDGVRRSFTSANLIVTQPHQQKQTQFSATPRRGASTGNSSSSSNRYLAGTVAQTAPVAQASAVGQAVASRAASCTSHQSTSSAKAAAAALIAAGGQSPYGRGAGSGAITPTSYGVESPAGSPSWARRATTSNDLRDRALAVQLSGNSMVHRLASQQGPTLTTAAPAGSAAGVGIYSSSPPREPGSPASMSSRGSTFPVVPSRLSNSGNCTPTARGAGGGIPSPSHVLSPQGSLAAGGSGSVGSISQRALMAILQQQQPQMLGPSAVYQQQLQQTQQLQQMQQQLQLQQLQHFHNMQQLRHQQQKGAAAAGRNSRVDSAAATAGLPLRVSTSASVGTIDAATQAAMLQEMNRVTMRRSSCAQFPLPQLYEYEDR